MGLVLLFQLILTGQWLIGGKNNRVLAIVRGFLYWCGLQVLVMLTMSCFLASLRRYFDRFVVNEVVTMGLFFLMYCCCVHGVYILVSRFASLSVVSAFDDESYRIASFYANDIKKRTHSEHWKFCKAKTAENIPLFQRFDLFGLGLAFVGISSVSVILLFVDFSSTPPFLNLTSIFIFYLLAGLLILFGRSMKNTASRFPMVSGQFFSSLNRVFILLNIGTLLVVFVVFLLQGIHENLNTPTEVALYTFSSIIGSLIIVLFFYGILLVLGSLCLSFSPVIRALLVAFTTWGLLLYYALLLLFDGFFGARNFRFMTMPNEAFGISWIAFFILLSLLLSPFIVQRFFNRHLRGVPLGELNLDHPSYAERPKDSEP